MSFDDLPSDAKREPVCIWTPGEDDTKTARSLVGKAPKVSSGLEQQSSVSQVFSPCMSPSKFAHRCPQHSKGWRKAARAQVIPSPGGRDRLRALCHH